MPSKGEGNKKKPLKENGVGCFNSKDNANTFGRFFSSLVN